ncbi:hypothetical protein [Parachlamydia sp. AcF125]|uniref:hypothetical protein n=1 Tax=Parachlamydia sp. AcF125 TaxID=2795736 RepID=UPI001BD85302|nr:hypothetical protein [Parachlamydia sp. AcF125]MBS4167790.1 hypothetical protein [Parachlamydia sp. AcF125]
MILDSEIKKLFNKLDHEDCAQITLMGSDIFVKTDHISQISLLTQVYFGENFIPQSVRHCLSGKAPFDDSALETFLSVDERQYKIFLNHNGKIDHLSHRTFIDVLEEFSHQAEEWKLVLDEHDKNDLVYSRVKS